MEIAATGILIGWPPQPGPPGDAILMESSGFVLVEGTGWILLEDEE